MTDRVKSCLEVDVGDHHLFPCLQYLVDDGSQDENIVLRTSFLPETILGVWKE